MRLYVFVFVFVFPDFAGGGEKREQPHTLSVHLETAGGRVQEVT